MSFKYFCGIASLLTVVMAGIFVYFYQLEKNFIVSQVDKQARILCQQVLLTRSWLADMGGVYVEKKAGLEANPYLEEGGIADSKTHKEYLLRNPAMVTRELSEYASRMGLYSFRLTSTQLINPDNAPDGTERLALDLFRQRKAREYIVRQELDGQQVFRLIAPLYIESACLSCHQYRGYELGTLRGCVSIIIPDHEVEARLVALKYSFFAAAGVIVMVAVLALFSINHLLAVRPLKMLRRRIRRFEVDVDYQVPVSARQDEIGDLERSFSQLTETVRESRAAMEGKIVRATTALRQANLELEKANRRLRIQDERKTDFLATVSHELRTPLTTIRGGVDYLLKTVTEREHVAFLQLLDKNISNLILMVNNLIDLARIELKKVDLDIEQVNIKELLAEVVLLFEATARDKGVTLSSDELQEVIVPLDYRRINQVFLNLLHNAVKFSPVGGTVSLVMTTVAGEQVEVAVVNQGEAIPAAELPTLFARYKSQPRCGSKRSAGLGLAIAKGLVEAHGGRLEARSGDGETRFTVVLPLGGRVMTGSRSARSGG
ncbi:MAG: DUF3365 domain-containing protein [Deltaproteobacteria bacterium]|nr:DUF3365 domain-containing protein [Candidatus Anaeroferrophillus wilburensis]MBN2887859.1 DUF3365 domain-containing protein [Deltaproteobacteria bacterium]